MSGLRQDFTYSLRVLLKNPAFTLVAVLCIALGIGANSAMFSFADALLLRPLPIRDPGRVVNVRGESPESPIQRLSYPDYLDLRDRNTTFDSLAAYSFVKLGYTPAGSQSSLMRSGVMVSANFFKTLGVEPEIGRGFTPAEDQPHSSDSVAVISRSFFKDQFGSDPSVLGKTIRLNGADFTVVGVTPERFTGLDPFRPAAVYLPLTASALTSTGQDLNRRDQRTLLVKGRLKPGVTPEAAHHELAGISLNLQRAYPDTNRDYRIAVRTELQSKVDASPQDAALMGMILGLAGVVLIIACANVANLLLSRARARTREIAMRLAVGASRWRLIRQLLAESLLVALAGGAGGLLVANAFVDFLQNIQLPADPPVVLAVQLDHRVLLFTALASILSAVLFGLVPALHSTKTDLVSALKAGDTAPGNRRRVFGRNLLVAGQVALSLVLLVTASLFIRNFQSQTAGGPGYRTGHLVMMSFDPALVHYTEPQTRQFYQTMEERARALPGVQRVALSNVVPMAGGDSQDVIPEGYQLPPGRTSISVSSATVTVDYLDALAIPMLSGRGFRATDQAGSARVAIVNEEMAKRYWPRQSAVGKRFKLDGPAGEWVEIAGVARNAKYHWIAESPLPFIYMPAAQNYSQKMTLMVQSIGDPASLAAPLRRLVRTFDPDLPVFDTRTMEDLYNKRAVQIPQTIFTVVLTMGLLGLILAVVGLYGLVSYSVSRQTREFGIRMAVGAARSTVLSQVLRSGLKLALGGIAVGMLLSLAAKRVVSSASRGASADLLTMIGVPALLLLVTVLATLIPALRASRIDPLKALRYE